MPAQKRFSVIQWQKICILLCIVSTYFLLTPQQADAHGYFVRSSPAENARLQSGQPPAFVQVWFAEAVEPSFSKLEVYNKDRQRVDQDDSSVAPDDPRSLIATLRPDLPDGAYTIVYRNVSQEDGHAVKGNVSFVVGAGPLPTNTSDLLNAQTTNENFNIWSVTTRWLNYIALAGLEGGLTFLLLVWRPGIRKLDTTKIGEELTLAKERLETQAYRIMLWSLLLLLVGWVTMLLYQASIVSGAAFWEVFGNGALGTLLLRSRFGLIWLIRLVLICVAFQFWFYKRRKIVEAEQTYLLPLWGLFLVGIAIALTTSLNSHAAAHPDAWLLVPADLLHLISTSFWVGGLVFLVFALPIAVRTLRPGTGDRTRLLAQLIPQFSLLALISMVTLGITGTIQAIAQLGSFPALWDNSYGQTLSIKLGLLAILVVLGAYNLLRISPRMKAFASKEDEETGAGSLAAGKTQRIFQRVVRTEVILAIVLLLVVGSLTSLSPPPRSITGVGKPFIQQGQMEDLTYRMVINPGIIGENSFEVEIKDNNGRPIENADMVIARFTMQDMDMGLQQIDFEPVEGQPGHYAASGSVLSMSGSWEIALLVRREGFDDQRASFQYTLEETSTNY